MSGLPSVLMESVGRSGLLPEGTDTERVVRRYLRHVDEQDQATRSPDALCGIMLRHFRLAGGPSAGPRIEVYWPDPETDGWDVGATIVQIVSRDLPFLVDTVSMEALRQGWNIQDLVHPQFSVRRNADGELTEILPESPAFSDPGLHRESWIHLELLPPTSEKSRDQLAEELVAGLSAALTRIEVVTSDWRPMTERVHDTIALLQRQAGDDSQLTQAIDLLEWLVADNFTFLGYHEFRLVDADTRARRFEPIVGSGLGILREEHEVANAFGALPLPGESSQVLVITKDNTRARVHRPSFRDYIGVRLMNESGQVLGERRFLGLFTVSAYAESVHRIPLLRAKADQILRHSGYEPDSHGAKSVVGVIESYPRDELFQGTAEELAPTIEQVSRLKERRQVRLFWRGDRYGRYASVLVFLPRDRYTTRVRLKMEAILRKHFNGESVDYQARMSESLLARLHFNVRVAPGATLPPVDSAVVEAELRAAARNWDDDFADAISGADNAGAFGSVATALPQGYREDFDARHAMMDIEALRQLGPDNPMDMVLYRPDAGMPGVDLRLKVFRQGAGFSLSEVMPHLSLLGVRVVDERPYELELPGAARDLIFDFGLQVPGTPEDWDPTARKRFTDAFAASYEGRCEADTLNQLVVSAGLDWREVTWLRAISRYLGQIGMPYSQNYIAEALLANPTLATGLVELFRARFDPAAHDAERVTTLSEQLSEQLDRVASLDQDRILRSMLNVLAGTVRTNAFRTDDLPGLPAADRAIALKILPGQITDAPYPRPAYEVFVDSPRVGGVHLRFGKVARGGLRWSDRREDFRTEILGLVKAQMVKNTVIVPVGAKGGFYPKQLPTGRDERQEEAKACYRIFINALLDVTDDLETGRNGASGRERAVIRPTDVVCYDDEDPYLVVAADKGTATFSDIANQIAVDRGYWLGDAFASGGSTGYDHKAMGITARGAWESVQRHFREIGTDPQHEDFTCVGIGDMSGDVFGNGMLCSEHIRLVAAFNHLHIFVDPEPDAAAGFAERRRLFELPRSSWSDYDTDLISAGGGVWSREAKSIPISPQMQSALGLDPETTALPPNDLIRAILTARVDLLWNGGIGTYVKGVGESSRDVGDRVNDPLRVNGAELRCRIVGEGGNLGLTQAGRIEYARAGGRLNTDFIDNSAGVDTSDHEVNIKILLAGEVEAGRLGVPERNELLASMTDTVADLVLAHNYDQNLALANAVALAPSTAFVHQRLIDDLVERGYVDRSLEGLPSDAELAERTAAGEGLTGPELATVLAWTKIAIAEDVLASDLPEDPYLADRLLGYFPEQLRQAYADRMPSHQLHREIITTAAVNRFVNASGITVAHRLHDETSAAVPDIIRAQLSARAIFAVGTDETLTRRLDHRVPAEVQTRMRLELRRLVERGTRWMLQNRRPPIDIPEVIQQFAGPVGTIKSNLPDLLTGRARAQATARQEELLAAGVPQRLAGVVAAAPTLFEALIIVEQALELERDVLEVARVYLAVAEALRLDELGDQISALPRQDRWDSLARGSMRDDLQHLHAELTLDVFSRSGEPDDDEERLDAAERVQRWKDRVRGLAGVETVIAAATEFEPDLARLSVALRAIRSL